MDSATHPSRFDGTKVTVMGLGAFGGGAGVTRWLAEQGADVLVTDTKPEADLHNSVAKLQDVINAGNVRLRLGEHNVSDFTTCDLVIANPAVNQPWDNRYLRAARAAGVAVRTEIGLLVERLPDRSKVVGVTGSAGKSTTSAMIVAAIQSAGQRCLFGGNIGGSLLHELGSSIQPDVYVVLELSSFMLHWLHEERWGALADSRWPRARGSDSACVPHVACVTNISPNHLDWHGSAAHYEQSKRWLVTDQRSGDAAILGPGLERWTLPHGVQRIDCKGHRVAGLRVPGSHNELNAGMALLAAKAASPNLDVERATSALRDFGGLPDRLQFVIERAGVKWFNDSKCTTPEACLLGVQSFAGARDDLRHVHLIVGGYDKGSDLSPVADLAERLAGLYTIGNTGPSIAAKARGRAIECETLEQAVVRIRDIAKPGDIALLSPACASWDQFENYQERGRQFCELVRGGV